MNILWVNGWGIPAEWLRNLAAGIFPDAAHTVVPPLAEHELLHERNRFDRVAGYSLGAFLVLREEIQLPCGRPVALLAPYFSFVAEDGLGGRVQRTRLRYLNRWFKREPAGALNDFYERAGLRELSGRSDLPYERKQLLSGLELLMNGTVPAAWPERASGFVGADDPLLDATRLHELCPHLKVVSGSGHHPAPLMRSLNRHWTSPC